MKRASRYLLIVNSINALHQLNKPGWSTPLFNESATYLVTGGLGGIGFEVVKWMLRSGAKHVAIASRSPPKPEVMEELELWNKSGLHVGTFSVDIGEFEQCRDLFHNLSSPDSGFPQIRGVMHAAGVLADAVLANQTWDKFNYTYNPKVKGSWNLHELTKDLLLEHFVVFSSMTALFGTPGQANHAASNCFEDALVAYRRGNGLPGTSINWGVWGEVGIATEVDIPGIRPMTTSQGILALETVLKTQTSHLCFNNVESFTLVGKICPYVKSYVEDKRLFGEVSGAVMFNSDEFWREVDKAEGREGKLAAFKKFIKLCLKNILKMDQSEEISDLKDFQDLGIDSLMMLEMKNALQNMLGSRLTLTVSQLKECTNTDLLANRLLDICLQGGDVKPENIEQ